VSRKRAKQLEVGTRGGRALAVVPFAVALLVGALVMPRTAPPDGVPLPQVNVKEIARAAAVDHELADRARQTLLPGEVRALGSAIRDFNVLEAKGAEDVAIAAARTALDTSFGLALSKSLESILQLRALQLEQFLVEVRRFEATGQESDELKALGGSFVRRMRLAGWCDDKNRVVLDDTQRRAAFKATWNGLLNLDKAAATRLAPDETRALYTLYLQHPHASEAARAEAELSRKQAQGERACADILRRERDSVDEWRLEKIKRLAEIDPSYPSGYAIGVVQFHRAQYPAATEAFRTWLVQHPSGPYALRARNYLKASIEAAAF
jgi:hypothetical protein